MSEEKTEEQPAGDQSADGEAEEEEAWGRLSPRLRGLIREELDEAEKRRKPAPASTNTKEKPAGEQPAETTKTEEKPTSDASSRPRRTAAEVWFGGRRSSSS